MKEPLILQYTRILRRHAPSAPAAQRFVQRHAGDPVFLRRAQTLNAVWLLKRGRPSS